MNRRRGLTLIELLVALSMAAMILTAMMSIAVDAIMAGKRTRVRAELGNNGAVVTQMLRNDLNSAGLGVPSGPDEETNTLFFRSSVLVAGATQFGILGDLPRPDANYNTMGFITDEPAGGGNNHHLSWHTENNGGCIPGSGKCSTAVHSRFFPGEDGCKTAAAAKLPERTCPWGLKRLRGGEPFLVIAGNRRWFNADSKDPLEVHEHGNGVYIHTGNSFPSAWKADSAASFPNAGAGQGWVTTLDRVFWRFDAGNRRLERIQCWGAVDPTHTNWPPLTATSVPATPCGAPFQGMSAYEVIATNVDAVLFTWFDAAGAPISNPATAGDKQRVRRVDFKITLSDTVNDVRVEHEAVGGVFLSMAL